MTMQTLTAGSPESQSTDLKATNIAALRALFPELVTERIVDGKTEIALNVDVLKQLVGDATVLDTDEKYGLNWHGKRRARQLALTPSTGTLRPAPEESVDWDTTQNLMIEGDNLEVLKLLQKSYAGKVKLIYIDPPYNTGKDFVYPDNFQDNIKNYLELTGQVEGGAKLSSNTEASGRFHTDWLRMMYPRLKLAHSLLKQDGVMLLSIDENEITNLKSIMSEVFGEENFISCLTWEKGRKNDAKFFSNGHEYVLVYAKSKGYLRDSKTVWREEKPGAREIWNQYLKLREEHGDNDAAIEFHLQTWFSDLPRVHPSKKWSRYKRIDKYGPWRDRDISWPGGGGPDYDVTHPTTGLPCKVPEAGWRYSTSEEMQRQIALGLVEFRADHTEPPFRKAHIKPVDVEFDTIDGEDGAEEEDEEELATQVRGSYFYKQSQVCIKYLRSLLGPKVFNNPKDHDEIVKLIRYVTNDDQNAIVLDFFAGSGTTGEAVIRLNESDNGRRRYLLVQLPEPLDSTKRDQKQAANFCAGIGQSGTIAEITKERLRRAGTKVKAETPTFSGDTGFRVFKLDTSNIRPWNPNRDDLEGSLIANLEHIQPGRSESDVLFEILLKLGLDLCVPIETRSIAGKTVHSVGGGVLLTCLDEHVKVTEVETLALGMAGWRREILHALGFTDEQMLKREDTAVFRDSAFENDVAKSNLAAILEQHGIKKVRSL